MLHNKFNLRATMLGKTAFGSRSPNSKWMNITSKRVYQQSIRVHASAKMGAGAEKAVTTERLNQFGIVEGFWNWDSGAQGTHRIRYQRGGMENASAPILVLLHGFGGNADHWRKNLPEYSKKYRVFSIDLLGYGYSDKPNPRQYEQNTLYCFENWSRQVRAFMDDFVPGESAYMICNSVGGLAGLQAALDEPAKASGVMLINISLRMLHVKKQNPLARPLVKAFQTMLRETDIGKMFFGSVAQPRTVKNILKQAYKDPDTVTDELVDVILKPGLEPGAVDVFLDFISYSGGPLPEDLIPQCRSPLWIVWGEEDPWEKVEWGRELAKLPTVSKFVTLPGVGHCPQDEAPQKVNPVVEDFVQATWAKRSGSASPSAAAVAPSS